MNYSYYVVFLILFVFWIALAYLFKKSVVRVSAPANFFMVFVLYFCGLFKRLDVGMYIFIGIVGVVLAIAIYLAVKRKDAVKFYKIVFNPTAILFLIAGVSFGILFTEMMSYHWDEMTHWALVTKNMITYDNFGNLGDTTTMFNQYVPATGVFMYAFQIFDTTFSNGHLYAAFDVLLLSMMLPVTEMFKNKLSLSAIISTLVFFAVPFIFKCTLYCELLVDGLLGVGLAYTYITYLVDKGKADYFTVLTVALASFFITLIKSTGIVMVIFGILYIALDAIVRNRKRIIPFLKNKANIAMLLLIVVLIVYAKVSWSVYCDVNETRAGWDSSEFTLSNFIAYLTQPNDFQQAVTDTFFKTFFIGKFYYQYDAYLQVPQLLMFGIIIIASVVVGIKTKDKVFAMANSVYSILIIFGFGLAMLFLYVFSFSYRESLGLAAFARYMSAMNIGVVMALMAQIIDGVVKPKENLVAYQKEDKGENVGILPYSIKKLAIFTTAVLVVAVSITAGFTVHIEKTVLIEKVGTEFYGDWIETSAKLSDTDSVYYVMHDYQENDKYVRRYLKVRFFATPTRCSGFTEGGSYKNGRDAKIFITGNPFSMDFTCEQLDEEAKAYKYLYLDKVSAKFIEKFGSLFEETPEGKVLYLRTEVEGKTVFVKTDL